MSDFTKKDRPTGVAEAMVAAMAVMSDPTNRAVHCPCGTTFLSGAAEKSEEGKPVCIGCGRAVVEKLP